MRLLQFFIIYLGLSQQTGPTPQRSHSDLEAAIGLKCYCASLTTDQISLCGTNKGIKIQNLKVFAICFIVSVFCAVIKSLPTTAAHNWEYEGHEWMQCVIQCNPADSESPAAASSNDGKYLRKWFFQLSPKQTHSQHSAVSDQLGVSQSGAAHLQNTNQGMTVMLYVVF